MKTYSIPVAKNNRIVNYVIKALTMTDAINEAVANGYIVIGKAVAI